MKLKVTSKTLNTLLRIIVCFVLVLANVMSPAIAAKAYAGDNDLGMKWTRAKSINDLEKACGTDKQQDWDPNSNNYWTPVLIVYQEGNNYYYLANGCVDNDEDNRVIRCTRVSKVSGIQPTQDTFTTRSRCDTPVIKFHSTADDEIMLRYTNSSGTLQNQWMNVNVEWWGVKWHAVHHVNVHSAGSPYDGFKYWSACSRDTDPWYDLVAGDDGKFRIRWISGHGGCTDRTWTYSGSEIEYSVGDNKGYQFYIFTGEPTGINYLESHMDIDAYTSYCMSDYTIPSNVEITVPTGATLIMSGNNHNCGHILVDGGTLILKGSLDADYGGSAGSRNGATFQPSDIDIINGGKLIVEKGGALMHRNKSSSLKIDSGSSAYIEGTLMVSNTLYIGEDCTIEALPGSLVAIGVRPNSDHDYENLVPSYLSGHKDEYMSDMITWDAMVFTNSFLFGGQYQNGGLYIGSGSSFISYGAVFLESTATKSINSGAYIDAYISTNRYASVGSMMRQWN